MPGDQPESDDLEHRVPIYVSVDDKDVVTVTPEPARVPDGWRNVRLAFTLTQPAGKTWKFPTHADESLGDFYGIRIREAGKTEFHRACRISDSEVHLVDKNDNRAKYFYTVTLVKHISTDPSIENRSDGRGQHAEPARAAVLER